MRKSRTALKVFACGFALMLVAASCGGDDDDDSGSSGTEPSETTDGSGSSSDGALKLGSLLTVTGDQGILGVSISQGVEQAVEEINANGGVLGQDVELTAEDTGGDAAVADTAFSSLTAAGVVGIIGTDSSSINLALIPKLSETDGPFMCAPASTSPKLSDPGTPMFVRTSPSDFLAGRALATQVLDDGHTRLAILALNLDYGQGYADAITENFEAAGGEVVANVALDPAGTTFDSEVSQALAAEPDAIALITFPDSGGTILNALATQGAGPQEMPTYTGDGLQVPDLYNLVNPDDPASTFGIKLIAVKPPAQDSPFVVTFTEANPDAPLTYAPQAYDCTMMIALAAELAGSTSAADIRESFPNVIASDGEECSSYADCAELIAGGAEKIKYSGAAASDYTWQDNADLAGGLFSVLEYGQDGVATEITTLDVSS